VCKTVDGTTVGCSEVRLGGNDEAENLSCVLGPASNSIQQGLHTSRCNKIHIAWDIAESFYFSTSKVRPHTMILQETGKVLETTRAIRIIKRLNLHEPYVFSTCTCIQQLLDEAWVSPSDSCPYYSRYRYSSYLVNVLLHISSDFFFGVHTEP
jgi:hypothetical protein